MHTRTLQLCAATSCMQPLAASVKDNNNYKQNTKNYKKNAFRS